jgi:hypothetical protein
MGGKVMNTLQHKLFPYVNDYVTNNVLPELLNNFEGENCCCIMAVGKAPDP